MSLLIFAGALAMAQDRVVDDFEGPAADWNWYNGSQVAAPGPRPGLAMQVTIPAGPGGYELAYTRESVLVTHRTLSWAAATTDGYLGSLLVALSSDSGYAGASDVIGITAVDTWQDMSLDTTDLCGDDVRVQISGFPYNYYQFVPSDFYVDDLVGSGTICPGFEDLDGDGLCVQGVDLDHDGFCVGVDEPRRSYDPVADCDDATFGGCLTLALSLPVPGQPLSFTVDGARAGESVTLVRDGRTGTRCPGALGGACVGVDRPIVAGVGVADAGGNLVLSVPVPIGAPSGAGGWFQAVAVRPGEAADTSAVVQVTLP